MARHAFALAGGRGERLWPLSRESRPKQLLAFSGGKTLLEGCLERCEGFSETSVTVLASAAIAKRIKASNVFAEPFGRNTAPACCFAAKLALVDDADATLLIAPADHLIPDRDAFVRDALRAADLAREGWLVTFGIPPGRPETGYGYLRTAEELSGGILGVERFVEKPDRPGAERLIRDERYLWNSGIFVWRADAFLRELSATHPGLCALTERLDPLDNNSVREFYQNAPSVSVDYAVMEKARKVAAVRASFGWDDVGSLLSAERFTPADEQGNHAVGEFLSSNSRNVTSYGSDGLVVVAGVEGLVIVHTPDVTLVVSKEYAERMRELLEYVKERADLERYLK